uniref:Uncharacterized protein n=1 Tax=Coccidioides posadasii RMSCC 3488 TaxID=454284 RepID=A0A0J6FBB9_COCPO|nr:hypothetical protein CPAG_02574 [Coccidioides posadasii RMSCC 3488]
MNIPCVLCTMHTFPRNLDHVPEAFVPRVKELLDLSTEREKNEQAMLRRIIDAEIHRKAKEFQNKYGAYVKDLKKKNAEEKDKCNPYNTRSKAAAGPAVEGVKTGPSSNIANDALMERFCTALEDTRRTLEGIEKGLNKIVSILEKAKVDVSIVHDRKRERSPSKQPEVPATREMKGSILGKRPYWDTL